MTGQANLPATAQCRTIDGSHHRPAQGLQATQLRLKHPHAVVERLGVGLLDLDQLVEVAAGEERLLGRGHHHAGDVVLFRFQPCDGGGHGLSVYSVHGVGALAGQVEGQHYDPVLAYFVTNGIGHD